MWVPSTYYHLTREKIIKKAEKNGCWEVGIEPINYGLFMKQSIAAATYISSTNIIDMARNYAFYFIVVLVMTSDSTPSTSRAQDTSDR
ncbi:hypothetical protein K7X08_000448 [Anisodus acutangulus]|uniref:Uncharacterized protein n=1 Tax=Anisodus acutangulus TaxID=402998 RepID=A0A9Q1RAY8_9SOLA|nr:hypothetical protein K7X08_000448 [Anisodus acutangulus]